MDDGSKRSSAEGSSRSRSSRRIGSQSPTARTRSRTHHSKCSSRSGKEEASSSDDEDDTDRMPLTATALAFTTSGSWRAAQSGYHSTSRGTSTSPVPMDTTPSLKDECECEAVTMSSTDMAVLGGASAGISVDTHAPDLSSLSRKHSPKHTPSSGRRLRSSLPASSKKSATFSSSTGGRTHDDGTRRSFDTRTQQHDFDELHSDDDLSEGRRSRRRMSRHSSAVGLGSSRLLAVGTEVRGPSPGALPPAVTWTSSAFTESMLAKSSGVGGDDGSWHKLMNLEQLFNLGMLSVKEYTQRKIRLVDNLTGTLIREKGKSGIAGAPALARGGSSEKGRMLGEKVIKKKQVPKWAEIAAVRAIRHSCTIVQNTEVWTEEIRHVKLAKHPFDNGSLRYVYYMQDITEAAEKKVKRRKRAKTIERTHASPPVSSLMTFSVPLMAATDSISTTASFPCVAARKRRAEDSRKSETITARIREPISSHVAKVAIDPCETRPMYFVDVAMQKHAQRFADQFNMYEVPKKIGFLDCWVYELLTLDCGHVYCGVERLIEGNYKKYTNNWDWAVERNTPQAFSHYTYEASEHRILICDLQGVGDLYTDPQMHTFDSKGCGQGNMGKRGMEKFLSTHKCNAICAFLKLPTVNPKSAVMGTLPSKRCIDSATIDTIPGVPTEYSIPEATDNPKALLLQQHSGYRSLEAGGGGVFGRFIDDDEDEYGKDAKQPYWCCCIL